jgi:hypothetical protein
MRFLSLLFAVTVLLALNGCSGTSQVERESFTSSEAREIYIEGHPECGFQENIRNGEIVRGMNEDEVLASWGMPNVYLTSMVSDEERFIYYVQDRETRSVLVYMLDFDEDNILYDWELDEKRLESYGLIGFEKAPAYYQNDLKIGKDKK